MTTARAKQVNLNATAYYHCVSRCVRRAFLMGNDPLTGKNFDHRKGWVIEELARLERIFAIDVCAYAVMCNHVHLVLRLCAIAARAWSDEETLDRARKLFPVAVETALAARSRSEVAAEYRERLSSLSWFMGCLNERIARRANREDGCTGRFWEGRFKSQPLLDAGALLACMTYVDLNPVRAGSAETLSDCHFTSIQARLAELGERERERRAGNKSQPRRAAQATASRDARRAASAVRLLPFAESLRDDDSDVLCPASTLPMSLADYVELVRFSGETQRKDGSACLSASTRDTLQMLRLDASNWDEAVGGFSSSKLAALGERHLIALEARRRGATRGYGVHWARRTYLSAA